MKVRIRAEGRSALLQDTEIVMGRSSYCTLPLDHPSISRVHAALRRIDGRLELIDLGSTNGTWVNGTRIEGPATVAVGDRVQLGDVAIEMEEIALRPARNTRTGHADATVETTASQSSDPLEQTHATATRRF